jgi:hypothetical protein
MVPYINSILPMVPLFFNEHDIEVVSAFSSSQIKFKQDQFFHMKIPLEKTCQILMKPYETFRVQWHLTT